MNLILFNKVLNFIKFVFLFMRYKGHVPIYVASAMVREYQRASVFFLHSMPTCVHGVSSLKAQTAVKVFHGQLCPYLRTLPPVTTQRPQKRQWQFFYKEHFWLHEKQLYVFIPSLLAKSYSSQLNRTVFTWKLSNLCIANVGYTSEYSWRCTTDYKPLKVCLQKMRCYPLNLFISSFL